MGLWIFRSPLVGLWRAQGDSKTEILKIWEDGIHGVLPMPAYC
jgi:hypothetical protein